jgi:tetratricopeptide (TPR) repeat protein
MLGARTVAAPLSKPFEFVDRLYVEAAALSGLKARSGLKLREGVRGAGTLRFLLQGIGRLRRVETEAEARRTMDDFELACRTEPEAASARAWLALAQHRMYGVTHDDAWLAKEEASAREAVSMDSNCVVARRALATALATKRDFQGSLDELARTCALDPTDDDSYSRFGRTYSRLGKPELEKETYRKVIAARPHCWQPYWWLAVSYFRNGEVEAAIGAFEQMIRRAPDLHKGYSSLGGLLVLRGDYTRAIDTLKLSVTLKPTKVAFDNLGTAYFNSGQLTESIDAYNQSFQFGFADYQSWLNLGDAYYWLRNREDQAAEAYAQAVRLGREQSATNERGGHTFDAMIPANLATVFPKLGQPDSARAFLGMALKADSSNSMVQYCAALTYWQLEEKPQGVAWLARAVQGGYPVVWLRDSPIFQPWRSEPGFQALIANAESPSRSTSNENGGRK